MAGIQIKTVSKVTPKCYAYTLPAVPSHKGWTKIGFTERDVETRIREQTHTAGLSPQIEWEKFAVYTTAPAGTFTDRNFHAYLKKLGIERKKGTEWFRIDPKEAKADFNDFAENHGNLDDSHADGAIPYTLRDEQAQAVQKAKAYFESHEKGEFLWNAKPRFGKTLSAYDLCRQLDAKNILIVTNRPAIANSWYDDYETFLGPSSGYLFVSGVDGLQEKPFVLSREEYLDRLMGHDADMGDVKGCIEFVSLQDLKGSVYFGGTLEKLKEVKDTEWDILIIDEAHEGVDTYKTSVAFDEIRRKSTLHLSGTPFKALANDKFASDAIYNWTYADEQKKKRDWDRKSETENPYENLPRLSLYTYRMSDAAWQKAEQGILIDDQVEEYAFDLNEFFAVNGQGKFIHEDDVDKFLDALTKQEKFPFSTEELRGELKHTFWLLNRVAAAKALAAKLKLHPVFKDYEIILAAGDGKLDDDEENEKSFDKVKKAIESCDKTITLSVGQLTTGVTIPEWTAVLMLSNMKSPALYMQAAFRAQNPCLFYDSATPSSYRKTDAYVFDFDPARTLSIFETFANDLIPETAGGKGDFREKKENVRRLLNFFPVYGEDDQGAMVELDAEQVLTIPRRIHAKEVVNRGFMSNFLFANITNVFSAPKELIEIIKAMPPVKEKKGRTLEGPDEHTAEKLGLNDKGEVDIPEKQVIGKADAIFGKKLYDEISRKTSEKVAELMKKEEENPDDRKKLLEGLKDQIADSISNTLITTAKDSYGRDFGKNTQRRMEREIKDIVTEPVEKEYGHYIIKSNQLEKEKKEKIKEAQKQQAPMQVITKLEADYEEKQKQAQKDMVAAIKKKVQDDSMTEKAAEIIVKTVETEKSEKARDEIAGSMRDHLRGFSRTIPAFLMAYGDENTTLANFDSPLSEEVFSEVTYNPQTKKGVTLEDFRHLRDGYDYKDEETGEEKHFEGHLFDEVVFNDAVKEFMKRRKELANYFDENVKGDIFDYIPPQRSNQIFTPKAVVQDMVDRLEKENPRCFDDPDSTFADLYMKSGMFITEVVKRLYRSPAMKKHFPNGAERLKHIFAKQVYGCAPTEVIYLICRRYIFGFTSTIQIEKNNIKLLDTLACAKEGQLEKKLKEIFRL